MAISNRKWLVVVWLAVITWLSTRGGIPLPGFKLLSADKLAHAAAYFNLVFGALWAFPPAGTSRRWWWFMLAGLYGALMEYVQLTWFPNRFFEYDDMVANFTGAGLAAVFYQRKHLFRF